jgi:predicted house-cleaning noncanonical NTP pyrophosphatase (MazG superfamily)
VPITRIRQARNPITYVADAEEHAPRLRNNLPKRCNEFSASGHDPEELADILEVLSASQSAEDGPRPGWER